MGKDAKMARLVGGPFDNDWHPRPPSEQRGEDVLLLRYRNLEGEPEEITVGGLPEERDEANSPVRLVSVYVYSWGQMRWQFAKEFPARNQQEVMQMIERGP